MWQISERFEDDNHYPKMASVNLNPDKDLNPYTIKYPLIWTGYVAGQKVEIIQISNSASYINDFDFKVFPEKYCFAKNKIINLIYTCLNTLN